MLTLPRCVPYIWEGDTGTQVQAEVLTATGLEELCLRGEHMGGGLEQIC